MFSKVLIANRGEIACRIMRSCHRLGIGTVAVHSDADADAAHVALADTSVRLGPPPASESYLRIHALIDAARATGADAIHPGYGFLSENPRFAEAAAAAGIVFVGPSATAMRAMALKDAAKDLMEKAGVPVVPGYHGPDQSDDRLANEARRTGYPLLIKAVAGGGGKGMRRVDSPDDFATALAGARGEAHSAFGNGNVLLERFINAPRHIEIQVFGDNHGNVVHLFERDCSLQRRHQKVIEEAPAPGMPPKMREAMGNAAVLAAHAIGYSGAGTVEFIVDGSDGLRPEGFWFMEMNARLQVEHPVTELVTGEDLVEWQLRVASGEPLPKAQGEISLRGHAFEARLYAEDPANDFLPATGRLDRLSFPEGVRIDAGVREGDQVSPWYDPMIAKIICSGPTRRAALSVLARALAGTRVEGLRTNLDFLTRLARQPDFGEGRVDTGLISRHLDRLTSVPEPGPFVTATAALALSGLSGRDSPLAGFSLWGPLPRTITLTRSNVGISHKVSCLGPGLFAVDGQEVRLQQQGDDEMLCTIDDVTHRLGVFTAGHSATIYEDGTPFRFTGTDPLESVVTSETGSDKIRAPMSGIVTAVATRPGAEVATGEILLTLEAMKMQHNLAAPRDGIVAEIGAEPGMQVTEGELLLKLQPRQG